MQPPSAPCWYIYLSCALISHPDLLSHLNSYLSLPAAEGNKIPLLWKRLTERREAAYETSSVQTEAYIRPFPVCVLRGGFNLSTSIVSHFSLWKNYKADGVKDRQRNQGKKVKRGKDVWSLAWSILMIGSASDCLVIVRPVQRLLRSNTKTIQSSTSPLFCSGDESRH